MEQRVSNVHHHDQTDDLWRAVEISERVAHVLKLARPHAAQEFALTEPPRRLDDTKKAPSEMGGEMKQFCVVMGELNFVGICEVPDDIA
jgi:uncharacterized protein with GYD domain